MNAESRRLNAEAELEAAAETLREAEALFGLGLLRGAVSRAYYSLFHAVRALLFGAGLEARTHQGVETLFHLHFVRTKQFAPHWGVLFARLQRYRERSDYGPALEIATGEVRRELDEVARFLERVRTSIP